MEDRQTITMQGHIDMVPQKNSDSSHDFVKDPISTYIDGEWLKAQGTTLGADNGIGVAAGLAVMLSDDIAHGPLEMLCTIEEETSMKGAFGLEPGYLKSDILMNLDTEDEGELYVGCAGGVDIISKIPVKTVPTPNDYLAFRISITGLMGGHSGLDIHKGRGNANQIVNRFLMDYADQLNIRVAEFDGGTLRNAIPRESFTTVAIPAAKEKHFRQAISDFQTLMLSEFGKTEKNLLVSIETISFPKTVLSSEDQKNIIQAIAACVSGSLRMSDEFEGVVDQIDQDLA